jgi:hypothetical protein
MPKIDQKILEEKYQKIIINEISAERVEKVTQNLDIEKLPFDNIFKGSMRILIGINASETYNEIKQELKKIPNYHDFDPQKKEVTKKIKLDDKYGGGYKEQKINIGKAISSLKIDEQKKKEYLNWIAKYHSNLSELEKNQEYSIVLSRHPVDVLRMSDMGNISSCHSEDGDYFRCAVQEAMTGGFIAFVVNTKKVKKAIEKDENKFKFEEFFKDSNRGVDGIVPLSRIRIRRYQDIDDESIDYAIPEVRVYGERGISGFYETIKNFLRNNQEIDVDNTYVDFTNGKLGKKGGSYQDSSDSELFNRYFDVNVFSGSVKHMDTDEDNEALEREEQFQEELDAFERNHNKQSFKHAYASYDMDTSMNDSVYYSINSGYIIDIYDIDFDEDFISELRVDDNYDLRKILKNETNDKKTHVLLSNFKKNLEELRIDILDYCDHLSTNGSKINIGLNFIEDFNYSSENTDEYEYALGQLKYYDQLYNKIKRCFVKTLYNTRLLNSKKNLNRYLDLDEDKKDSILTSLKHFRKNEYNVKKIIYETSIPIDKKPIDNTDRTLFGEAIKSSLENYIKKYYKPVVDNTDNNLTFKNFFENFEIKYDDFDVNLIYTNSNTTGIEVYIEITIQEYTENTLNFLLFMDESYNYLKMLFKKQYAESFKVDKTFKKNEYDDNFLQKTI